MVIYIYIYYIFNWTLVFHSQTQPTLNEGLGRKIQGVYFVPLTMVITMCVSNTHLLLTKNDFGIHSFLRCSFLQFSMLTCLKKL